jgi:hypothetical protein
MNLDAARRSARATKRFRGGIVMPDVIYSLLIVAFFVLAWKMVEACERL